MEQINLREAINASKTIMENNGSKDHYFSGYGQCCFRTNENIQLSLGNLEFNKERALSVMASGDQVFNLIYLGVKDIDAFDINALTYFVYQLRRAIFLAYGYENSSFIEALFMNRNCNPEQLLEILKSLRPFMSDDAYTYFEEILKYNCYLSSLQDIGNQFPFLCKRHVAFMSNNLYNKSKSGFQRLQDNLTSSSVRFMNSDIESLPSTLDKEYDIMHFSDIVQSYVLKQEEREFMELMWQFYQKLKANGLIINYFLSSFDLDMLMLDMKYFRNLGFEGAVRTRTNRKNSHALIMRKR